MIKFIRGRSSGVHMRIDEAGQHRLSGQINPLRLRSRQLQDAVIGANRGDLLTLYRDRFLDGKAAVDGDDVTVMENEIRRFSPACRGR